jgi:hypothetical protein
MPIAINEMMALPGISRSAPGYIPEWVEQIRVKAYLYQERGQMYRWNSGQETG